MVSHQLHPRHPGSSEHQRASRFTIHRTCLVILCYQDYSPNAKVPRKGANFSPWFLNSFWVLHSCNQRACPCAMSPPDTFAFCEYLDVHNDTQTLHFTIMAGHPSSWHIEHTSCQCAKSPILMVDLSRVYRTGSCPRGTLVCGGTDSRRLLKGMGPSDARNTSAPSPARRQLYLTPQLTTISLAVCLQNVATIAADMQSGMPTLYVCC